MTEEDLRRAMTVLESYRGQLEALEKQHEIVRLSLEEFVRAGETLRQYRDSGEGREILVPVGANSYVTAGIRSPDRVLVGIGSNLVIEDTVESARTRLEVRVKSLEEAAHTLEARIEEIGARAEAQGEVVEDLYAQTRGATPG